jgi:hypothetical protein
MNAEANARAELKRPPASAGVQTARILDRLRTHEWVSGADFRSPTCDGGPEIRNITPRVSDLRRCHQIVSERGADGCARYRLTWDRGDHAPPFDEIVTEAREAVDDAGEQIALELTASPPARSAVYGDWDA